MQQIQLRGKKKIHKKCVVPKCTVAENRSIENHQCIELIGKLCGNDVDKKANYMKEYQKAIEAKSLKDFLKKLQVFRATKRKNAAGGTMRILFDRHFYVLSDKPSAGNFAYLALMMTSALPPLPPGHWKPSAFEPPPAAPIAWTRILV